MPTPFKPDRAYRLPPDPEIVTRDGRPHVRLKERGRAVFYPLSRDGRQYLKPAKKFYGEFKNAAGVLQRVALSADKAAAQAMLNDLVRQAERERAGYKDAAAPHRARPLQGHMEEWLQVLAARGRTEAYTAQKKARVSAILDGCGFVFTPDLTADRLERFLDSLRAGPRRLSVQTTNDYLQAVAQFCRWMVENDRLNRNPFARVKKGNPERDRRHVRRVLGLDELRALVAATRAGGVDRRKLGAGERAVLYWTGAYTGYRSRELAALSPACFRMAADPPTIDLGGEFTKNGKNASQPVPPDLAAALRDFLQGRPPDLPVWPGLWADRAAAMIRRDAAAAGLPLDVDTKDGPQVLDFHSLRGTYATFLDGLGLSQKQLMELMRHSDPRLTLNRYTRVRLHDLGAAVDRLPALSPPGAQPAALRPTGTGGAFGADAVPGAVAGDGPRLAVMTGDETKARG